MNTCGTCRHWLRPDQRRGYGNAVSYEGDEWADEETGSGYKRGDKDDLLFGSCEGIRHGAGFTMADETPLATVRDMSDMATIYTRPEFGCALWAAIEPEPT